jgi:hypothetical protein
MNREEQNVWRDFDYVSKDFPHTFIRADIAGRRTVMIRTLRDFMSMIRADSPHKTFKTVKDGLGWTIKVKLEEWQL